MFADFRGVTLATQVKNIEEHFADSNNGRVASPPKIEILLPQRHPGQRTTLFASAKQLIFDNTIALRITEAM